MYEEDLNGYFILKNLKEVVIISINDMLTATILHDKIKLLIDNPIILGAALNYYYCRADGYALKKSTNSLLIPEIVCNKFYIQSNKQ